jgi:hypothetical protein
VAETDITTDGAPSDPAGGGSRQWLESLDPKVAIALGVVALCAGIWIGFKLAGGTVSETRCRECEEKHEQAKRAAAYEQGVTDAQQADGPVV